MSSIERNIYLEEGMSKLRTASILFIVSSLLVGVGALLLWPLMTMATSVAVVSSKAHAIDSPVMAIAGLLGIMAILLVGAIISLIALFAYLIPSFSSLSNYDPSAFNTPKKLVKIGFIVGFILLILAPLLGLTVILAMRTPAVIIGMLILLIIAAILLLIGKIGLAVGMFRLRDKVHETLFLVAGILFIIGIFISIVDFIGWILVLIAAGSTLDKLRAKQVPSTTPT